MFTLIKKAFVYSPEPLGIKDVLVSCGKIVLIEDDINITGLGEIQVFNADGLLMLPGFIDQHVHIVGGGGEGSFATRTAEITPNELYENGITTVVGILGTDGVTRTVGNLYAKACELEEKGLTTYIYTGSYQVPPVTLTGDIQKDIVYIDKVVGVGEIAISDHRSYNPSEEELERLAAMARVSGMIGGKAGVIHLHMGDGKDGLKPVLNAVEATSIPIAQFVPSHVNRNKRLFDEALLFWDRGGNMDLTAGFEKEAGFVDCVPSYVAMKMIVNSGRTLERVTLSSDANGSAPSFDADGNLVKLEVASCSKLLEDARKAIFNLGLDITQVLKTFTSNPAQLLKFKNKGTISVGKDSDFLLVDEGLNIIKVHTSHFLK